MVKLSIVVKKTALIAAGAVAMAPSIVLATSGYGDNVAQEEMNGEVGYGLIGDDSGSDNFDGLDVNLDDFGLGLQLWQQAEVIAQERAAEAFWAKTVSDAAVAEVQRREQEGKLFGFRRPGSGPSYAERKAAAVAELDAKDQRRIERARQQMEDEQADGRMIEEDQFDNAYTDFAFSGVGLGDFGIDVEHQSQAQNLGGQNAGEVVGPTGEVVPLHRFLRGRDVADTAARVANMRSQRRFRERWDGQWMGLPLSEEKRAEAAYQQARDHHRRTIQEDEEQ